MTTKIISLYQTPYYNTITKQYTKVITIRPPLTSLPTNLKSNFRFISIPPISDYTNTNTICHQIAWDTTHNQPLNPNNTATLINNLILHMSYTIDNTLTQLLENIHTEDNSSLLVVGRIP